MASPVPKFAHNWTRQNNATCSTHLCAHKPMLDDRVSICNLIHACARDARHALPYGEPSRHTHTHTHLPHSCAMTYYGVGDAQMCMQSGRRATESGVYLRLGGCTHRSPVQDHGHLGGLVHVAAERSTGPGARVAVVLPTAAAAAAAAP